MLFAQNRHNSQYPHLKLRLVFIALSISLQVYSALIFSSNSTFHTNGTTLIWVLHGYWSLQTTAATARPMYIVFDLALKKKEAKGFT